MMKKGTPINLHHRLEEALGRRRRKLPLVLEEGDLNVLGRFQVCLKFVRRSVLDVVCGRSFQRQMIIRLLIS